jgi:hypothetical protein
MWKFILGVAVGWMLYSVSLPASHAEPQCCYYGHLRVCPCDS